MNTLFIQSIFYMLLAYFMSGCGEDPSTAVSGSTSTDDGKSFTGETILSNWKTVCIDNHLSMVESNYQNCLSVYTSTPQLLPQCDTDKTSNIALLHSYWSDIAATAMADYHQCLTDALENVSSCQGKYEKEIAFEVNLKCPEAAVYYF